jgi:uncharacterized protein (DUF2147 family)
MRTKLIATALALLPLVAAAANPSPVGRWKTFDEDTGKPRLVVDVYQAQNGTLAAKVVETLYAPNAACDACTGPKKNAPITGMVIFWNQKPVDADSYAGGTVLKLSNGKTYKSKLELVDGGNKLDVYGCLGFICKHQTWTRE